MSQEQIDESTKMDKHNSEILLAAQPVTTTANNISSLKDGALLQKNEDSQSPPPTPMDLLELTLKHSSNGCEAEFRQSSKLLVQLVRKSRPGASAASALMTRLTTSVTHLINNPQGKTGLSTKKRTVEYLLTLIKFLHKEKLFSSFILHSQLIQAYHNWNERISSYTSGLLTSLDENALFSADMSTMLSLHRILTEHQKLNHLRFLKSAIHYDHSNPTAAPSDLLTHTSVSVSSLTSSEFDEFIDLLMEYLFTWGNDDKKRSYEGLEFTTQILNIVKSLAPEEVKNELCTIFLRNDLPVWIRICVAPFLINKSQQLLLPPTDFPLSIFHHGNNSTKFQSPLDIKFCSQMSKHFTKNTELLSELHDFENCLKKFTNEAENICKRFKISQKMLLQHIVLGEI